MDDVIFGFASGLLGGILITLGIVTFSSNPTAFELLTACAKSNNVYQCEMVAVPVTEESGR